MTLIRTRKISSKSSNLRDAAVTDIALFQNTLKTNMTATIQNILVLMEANIEKDMDAYVLGHNIQLQNMIEEIKNEMRTELFLYLQN